MGREKHPARLALGQIRYQLLLLVRSPLGFFLTLVVPVLLFVCLNLLTPDTMAAAPGGLRYVQFLTPAIATFCLLNACYVNTITGVVPGPLTRSSGATSRNSPISSRKRGLPSDSIANTTSRSAGSAIAS